MAGKATTYEAARAAAPVNQNKDKSEIHTFEILADAADGTILSKASDKAIHGFITKVVTNPGSPAPTDDYDLTLTDDQGTDVMGGTLGNRDTATSEQALPLIGAAYGTVRVDSVLTLNGSGNSVNSAVIVVQVHISKEQA